MPKQKHTVEVFKPDFAIEENLELHERGWKVQRVGWIFILLFVLLAALGVFGDGIASKRTSSDGPVKLEYDRFFRYEARMQLKVEVGENAGAYTIISLPNAYLKHFRIESILPEPKENKIQANMISYLFEGTAPMNVVFYLVPQKIGNINGAMQVNNAQLPLTHFIYP